MGVVLSQGAGQEVEVRKKEIEMCPECDEEIEDGQEKTIVSGTSWHKWCFQKIAGAQQVEETLDLRETCPACDQIIDEGEEKSIVRGKEWHLHCFQSLKAQMASKKPKSEKSGKKKKKKKKTVK